MTTDRDERIRQLAYELWEREDHPQGRDAEHWRMAAAVFEAQMTGSRLDDAGQPIGMVLQASQERTMSTPAATPKARRGRKPQVDAARPAGETAPATKRRRRTKAEMAAAAAGVAGAAAAIAATVAATRRRRGPKAAAAGEAAPAPAATAAPRRARRTTSKSTPSEADPAPATVASDAATGARPDPSADAPSDVTAGLVPDPGAEPPSDASLETFPESGPDADPSGERVAE